jgi:hypothetical protein
VSLNSYYLLLAICLAAAGGLLVLRSRWNTPSRALELLLVSAVLLPFERSSLSLALLVTMFVCGDWMMRLLLVKRTVVFDGARVVSAVLSFMAIAALSFVVGQYPWFPTAGAPLRAQIGGLAIFLFSGGLFLAVGHQITTLKQLERLTWIFVAAGAAQVGMMVFLGFDVVAGGVAVTNGASVGGLFWVWLVAVSFSQGLCNRDLALWARLGCLAAGTLTLGRSVILAFDWASGWLPALVSLAVVILVRFPRLTISGAALACAPALVIGAQAVDAILTGESYSWMTRLEAARTTWQMLERNPWFGFGPANYYHYALLFPILGWWVRFSTHNNYLDLLAQTGVIGLLAFGWFVVEAFLLAGRLRKQPLGGFARAYTVGAIAGLSGSLVSGLLADWIVPFTYNIGLRGFRSSLLFWFFLGGLLAIKRLMSVQTALRPADLRIPSPSRRLAPAVS